MTWADATYAVWAFCALGVATLWLASARGWPRSQARVGRPAAIIRAVLVRRWVRILFVLGWIWVGVHTFAR